MMGDETCYKCGSEADNFIEKDGIKLFYCSVHYLEKFETMDIDGLEEELLSESDE